MANLTTTALVKGYANISDSADDQAIMGIISAVSVHLHDLVGHDYEGAALTGEHHSAPYSGAVVLHKPAASIDAIREGGTTLAATGYELEAERLVWRLASGLTVDWGAGKRNIEVDYTTTTEVPEDLELAAREVSAFMVKQSALAAGGSRMGLSAQANSDSGSADYFVQAINQLPFASAVVRRYQRLV